MMNNDVVVRMEGITKTFGKVVANDHVNLEVCRGEVHSILGENGAGKSSLMNVLSGVYKPEEGTIEIKGNEVRFHSPKDAISVGIGMIYQHFKLVNAMTAKENIIAGQKGDFYIDPQKASKDIRAISEKYGLEIDPDKVVRHMSVAEKQRVEILKVIYRGADILILDEPTAVLTPQETEKLFNIINRMKAAGCSILIITHKLHEVMEISDRITVLRKGKYITTVPNQNTNPRALTDLMVGKSVSLSIERVEAELQEGLLEVQALTTVNMDRVKTLKGVSFKLHGGEILGVAGVANSGQKELCEAIAGLEKANSGNIVFKGESIVGFNPRDIIDKGISMSFVPEDRLGMGLVSTMDITNNILLKEYRKQKGFFITRKNARKMATYLIEKLNIDTPGAEHPVRLLSGGNIQKVLLGREIENNPQLIISAYPSRGLDVGSAHLVYDLLNDQKKKGVGVIYVGEDLDVLLELCDRIMVLCAGEITGVVKASETTKEEIGFMMSGKHDEKEVQTV